PGDAHGLHAGLAFGPFIPPTGQRRPAFAVLTREDYRQLAERCALLAGECGAPGVAEALRALALDYLNYRVEPCGVRLPHAPKSGFGQFNHPILMADEIQVRGEYKQIYGGSTSERARARR